MKKLISILTLAAIMLTSVVAFADEVVGDGTITEIQGDIMLISEPVEDGTIEEIQGDIMLIDDAEETVVETTYDKQVLEGSIVSVEESQLIINVGSEYAINIDANTIIIDENAKEIALADLRAGAPVRVIASTMTTRSIPPQSYGYVVMVSSVKTPMFPIYAEVATVTETEDAVIVDSADEAYAINIIEDTQVVSLDGSAYEAELKKDDIVLFYTDLLTFSIPAQGTANKVVVIGELVAPETEEEEVVETTVTTIDKVVINGADVATNVIADSDPTLLHVRAVCEAMGLEIAWDEELFAVTVGTVPMGVNFRIGENSYNKARMTPFTLSVEPQLINDLTYVPVDFYTEVLGAQVEIVDGTLNINYSIVE